MADSGIFDLGTSGTGVSTGCKLSAIPRSSDILRRIKPLFPVVALIEARQAGVQNDLCGKARLDITGKNGAVADLRRNHFIHRQQRALAQVAVGGASALASVVAVPLALL